MGSKQDRQPRWNRLYLILILALGGLVAHRLLHLTPTGHKIALLLIITAIYGLMATWVKSNAARLQDLEGEEYRKQSRDPAVYGTLQFPTATQSHYRAVMSFYQQESPDNQEK